MNDNQKLIPQYVTTKPRALYNTFIADIDISLENGKPYQLLTGKTLPWYNALASICL